MPRNDENWTTLEDLEAKWARDPEHLLAEFRIKPYFVVAQDVFELRQEIGLTQEQLAERAQTHQSRISKVESAELDFKLSTLIKIAEALDAHVDIHIVKNLIETDASYRQLFSGAITIEDSSLQTGIRPEIRLTHTSHMKTVKA
jgi:transcriptional regulator with XRE-family HTH domain